MAPRRDVPLRRSRLYRACRTISDREEQPPGLYSDGLDVCRHDRFRQNVGSVECRERSAALAMLQLRFDPECRRGFSRPWDDDLESNFWPGRATFPALARPSTA